MDNFQEELTGAGTLVPFPQEQYDATTKDDTEGNQAAV